MADTGLKLPSALSKLCVDYRASGGLLTGQLLTDDVCTCSKDEVFCNDY